MSVTIPLLLLISALLLFIGLISFLVIAFVARLGKMTNRKSVNSSQTDDIEEVNAWEESGKRVE